MRRSNGQVTQTLRRTTALGLACVALWVMAHAVGLPERAKTWDLFLREDNDWAVRLLSSQLPLPPREDLSPWQRLVLAQSPLLHAVAADPAFLAQDGEVPADDPEEEDLTEPELVRTDPDPDGVVSKTMGPSAGQDYLRAGDIYIANRAQKQVDAAALADVPVRFALAEGPQILILHSHGSEAYTPTSQDSYRESDPYRTTDCNHNVVRVGEEMARIFREQGFGVVHDTTLYDYPSYGEAYDRSLEAARLWLARYPTIRVVLDVHRDALAAEDGTIYKVISAEDEGQAAQVMLVVGTDGTKTHPLWQENLTFAMGIQRQLLDDYSALARPMVLRASRYNQHLSVGSVLVEVGTHGNSLQEALLGARLFAQSAAKVLEELREP